MTTAFSDAEGDLSLAERGEPCARAIAPPLSEWPAQRPGSVPENLLSSSRLPDGDVPSFSPLPLIGSDVYSGAAPLIPLRSRDLAVLEDLFQQDEIDSMQAEILSVLLLLHPEPCWEDDPLDFLKEYL